MTEQRRTPVRLSRAEKAIVLVLISALLAFAEYSMRTSGATDAVSALIQSSDTIVHHLGEIDSVIVPPIVGGLGSSQGEDCTRQNLLVIIRGRERTRLAFLRMTREKDNHWRIYRCNIIGLLHSIRCVD